jgi:8-hydroxy-5-deazaflavin:NADPH oxidoreductase
VRIVVLGSGGVGRTLAAAFRDVGHTVVLGTRDTAATGAREDVAAWTAEHPDIPLVPLAGAADGAGLVVNATSGAAATEALEALGEGALDGVVVLDVANPLDFSRGFPPTLSISNDDSLAEVIQRRFPAARVVKSLNTMAAELMVDPGALGGGDHTVLLSGDDPAAKAVVEGLLRELGWTDVLDLGDLSTARGAEMWLPLWLRLWQATGQRHIQLKVVR